MPAFGRLADGTFWSPKHWENKTMSGRELAELVLKMRNSQKGYFKFRNPEDLEKSKALERAVDKAVLGIMDSQKKMFEDDD